MKYISIIESGSTISELEVKLNKRLEHFLPGMYEISSPSMFYADEKWVAICIAYPLQ